VKTHVLPSTVNWALGAGESGKSKAMWVIIPQDA
jgi:hypothetical protein